MNQCSRCEPKSRSGSNDHKADVKLYDAVCRLFVSETSEKGSPGMKNSGSTFIIPTHNALTVNVSPNPASTWVAFEYSLPFGMKATNLQITDANGRIVETFEVSGPEGQKLWDIREVKPGVYFYSLATSGFTKTGKIIISK